MPLHSRCFSPFIWTFIILLHPLFPPQFPLPFVVVVVVDGATAVANSCPQGQFFFGPCVANICPARCPGVCACFGPAGAQDCCSTVSDRNGGDGNGLASSTLTRLLLALLLTSPSSSLGQLRLVLCRDIALNCALLSIYCSIPAYALCMRAHCAATCGLCNNDGGGLFGPSLLSLLAFDGAAGIGTNLLAIRSEAPTIRDNDEQEESNKTAPLLRMKKGKGKSNYAGDKEKVEKGGAGQMPIQQQQQQQSQSQQQPQLRAPVPIQLAIPPGLIIPDRQTIRQKMAQIVRRLNGGG